MSAGGCDAEFVRVIGMRFQINVPPGAPDEEHAGGNVPKTDRAFDVCIKAAGGDIGDVEGGTAEHAHFFHAPDGLVENGKCAVDRIDGLRDAHRDDAILQLRPFAYFDAFPVHECRSIKFSRPSFIAHGVMDYAGEKGAVASNSNRRGEMRDSVEIIHRAIQGIDDPLVFSRASPHPFFPENGVTAMSRQDVCLDELLGAAVEFQFDVMRMHGIDLEGLFEIFAEKSSGKKCRINGGRQKFRHVEVGISRVGARSGQKNWEGNESPPMK
jgi:hypothetical protein